ncbi:4-amino-4-deoxy-L-arabinose-phosphoundecaprenol flippase subunit ArnE [Pantoea sp. 1.19]|uniref:4-amino-4-deoxy-L-arabinose-phosphoundecaprenol flippase subunit ArnE n=1 Tax=Pantoea sp. 1.19 TaxID=1925589 RepID=UPI000948CD64|nr:4-amino-4-deoxy-L-arabinose-phosphoundecaprenol flippase subunit ArnE [Pantoea sp. 1.19]
MNLLLILLVSLISCAGQLCQKQAARQQGRAAVLRWLALSLLLLGLAMLLWLWVLQRVPVSVAYPMLSLNVILVVLAARLLWREPVSARHWGGIALIVTGVALLGSWA